MKNLLVALLSVGLAVSACAQAPTTPKAAMDSFQIPSHGVGLNALMYMAAGAGPHPTVVLLHGFPGNERNLDLAQDIRRAGWDVLYFNYRGAWGTAGDFSFTHCLEDVAAVLAYLRDPENAKRLRVDPTRLVLLGHSMGGFMAIEAGAADTGVIAIGTISAADMTGRIPLDLPKANEPIAVAAVSKGLAAEGMAPLAGCTPDGLAKELVAHRKEWSWAAKAEPMKSRPVLVVTSDDGLAGADDAFAAALKAAGDIHVTVAHFATDHPYSDKRLELSAAVLQWLGTVTTAK